VRKLGLLTVLLLCLGIAAAAPSTFGAPEGSSFLAADVSQVGIVNLAYLGTPGSVVEFDESRGGKSIALGTATIGPQSFAVLLRATTWRCDPQTREFTAVARAPDGTVTTGSFTTRTPSCSERLALAVSRPGGSDRRLRFRITDGWRLGGVAAQVCVAPRGLALVCHTVTFAPGVTSVDRTFALARPGAWHGALRIRGATVRVLDGTEARDERPVLLATGDSTIQGIDGVLSDRLRSQVRVRSESHPGTGISRSIASFDWRRIARRQAAQIAPLITVISIGVNDGFDMVTPKGAHVPCCGAGWTAEYARRVATMMASYGRGGAARTFWLELPVPRNPALANVVAAVNAAIAVAAGGSETARVVPLAALLSPGGRFHASIRHDGRTVRVRQADGIHLTPGGAAIAADAVIAALKADPPPAP
jgi:lysophospholipase L1-like esterase